MRPASFFFAMLVVLLIYTPTHAHLLRMDCLDEQVKDPELTKEPLVRIFLKLPMTHDDVEKLSSGAEGDGLLGGCGTFKSLYQASREEGKGEKRQTDRQTDRERVGWREEKTKRVRLRGDRGG
jgi:hypothetical protein